MATFGDACCATSMVVCPAIIYVVHLSGETAGKLGSPSANMNGKMSEVIACFVYRLVQQ